MSKKLNEEILEIYKNYDKSIRDAHLKILALEKHYKNRTSKDNEVILNKILEYVGESSDDNK